MTSYTWILLIFASLAATRAQGMVYLLNCYYFVLVTALVTFLELGA